MEDLSYWDLWTSVMRDGETSVIKAEGAQLWGLEVLRYE